MLQKGSSAEIIVARDVICAVGPGLPLSLFLSLSFYGYFDALDERKERLEEGVTLRVLDDDLSAFLLSTDI